MESDEMIKRALVILSLICSVNLFAEETMIQKEMLVSIEKVSAIGKLRNDGYFVIIDGKTIEISKTQYDKICKYYEAISDSTTVLAFKNGDVYQLTKPVETQEAVQK